MCPTRRSGLFNHQPDTHDLDKPTARLNSNDMRGSMTINRIVVGVSPDELRASFETEIDKVRKYIAWQGVQLDPFNNSLKDEASKIVHGRRDRLRKPATSLPHWDIHYPTVRVRLRLTFHQQSGVKFHKSSPLRPALLARAHDRGSRISEFPSIIENMSFVMERTRGYFRALRRDDQGSLPRSAQRAIRGNGYRRNFQRRWTYRYTCARREHQPFRC